LDHFVLDTPYFPGIHRTSSGHPIPASEFHVGTHATRPWQHIIYNPHNGYVLFDPDGNGPEAPIHFATVSPHLSISYADFLEA
jgi:hypothetical protein